MIRLGLEVALSEPLTSLADARFGLLMNQASVDHRFQYACDLLAARFPGQLAAIFTPQHGLWSEQQANMIESPHGWHEMLRVPIYSLYSETRKPTKEMLQQLDCLVIDLQDVGTRVYTFIWSIAYCLEACSEAGIPVVVLDRPNPLGGEVVEGPTLAAGYESFVGRVSIPMRHGLTIGELALLVRRELAIEAELDIVRMEGWQRRMLFPDTGRRWVLPSPNMPGFTTTLLYPGQVLLEGTNLSEGRGTTIPFELVGAPFIDPRMLYEELIRMDHPGLHFRPVRFVPTFDKWHGQSCGGIALHVVDPAAVRSFRTTLAVLSAVKRLWPDPFAWLPPPYEYEREKMPIDILYGSPRLRTAVDGGTVPDVDDLAAVDAESWHQCVESIRLY